jgi:hypothetical protein
VLFTRVESSLLTVREILASAGLRQVDSHPGLPVMPDVETWVCDAEMLLKITVAPEERPGADAIPARVQSALLSSGFALAGAARGDDVSYASCPDAALAAGRTVRLVRAN